MKASHLENQYYSASFWRISSQRNDLTDLKLLLSTLWLFKASESQNCPFNWLQWIKITLWDITAWEKKSIILTLLETNATELKPYKKIWDDGKKTFSINFTCEKKDRGLQWWYKCLFHILEVWHAAVSAHWRSYVFLLLYCIKHCLYMSCITDVDDNLALKKQTNTHVLNKTTLAL